MRSISTFPLYLVILACEIGLLHSLARQRNQTTLPDLIPARMENNGGWEKVLRVLSISSVDMGENQARRMYAICNS